MKSKNTFAATFGLTRPVYADTVVSSDKVATYSTLEGRERERDTCPFEKTGSSNHQLRYEVESIRKGDPVVPQIGPRFSRRESWSRYVSLKERRYNDFRRELCVEACDIPLSDSLFSSSCRRSYVYARRIVSVFTLARNRTFVTRDFE